MNTSSATNRSGRARGVLLLPLAVWLGGCSTTVHTRSEIRIARPPSEVFAYLASYEHMPEWNYYVTSVERRTPGETRMGSVFHQIRKSDEQSLRVVELVPDARIAFATEPPARAVVLRFELVPEAGGTRLIERWELDGGFGARLIGPIVGWRIESAVDVNLRVLQRLLEERCAVLPDGRVVTR